jgi:hypothetical protein
MSLPNSIRLIHGRITIAFDVQQISLLTLSNQRRQYEYYTLCRGTVVISLNKIYLCRCNRYSMCGANITYTIYIMFNFGVSNFGFII